jgi:hypothetical protein
MRQGAAPGFLKVLQPLLDSKEITLTGQGYQVADAEPTPATGKAWQDVYNEAVNDPSMPIPLLMELDWQANGYIPAAKRPPRIGDSLLWLLQLEQGAGGQCGRLDGDYLTFDNIGYQKYIADIDQYGIPDGVLNRYVCKAS